jgi:tetratricopeptide (TPR) repeat protein
MERSIGLSLFGLPRRILDLARDRKNTAMRDSAEIQDLIARGDLESALDRIEEDERQSAEAIELLRRLIHQASQDPETFASSDIRLTAAYALSTRLAHAGDLPGALAALDNALDLHTASLTSDITDQCDYLSWDAHDKVVRLALRCGDLVTARRRLEKLLWVAELIRRNWPRKGSEEPLWQSGHHFHHAERLVLAHEGRFEDAQANLAAELRASRSRIGYETSLVWEGKVRACGHSS